MDGTNAVRGGVMLMGHSANNDVKLINTIIADNILYDNNSNGAQGGVFCMANAGDLELINCTVVNNKIITNYSWGSGSVIFASDNNNDGYAPHFTVFNSIIHSNTITINAGTPSESLSQINQFQLTEFNDGTEVYASYSLIGGDDDLGGDDILLNVEPEFLDSTYALHPRSAAIGAGAVGSENAEGNNIYAPTVDIAGNIRPNPAAAGLYDGGEAVPDLGAWEHELPVTPYPSAVEDMTATPLHKSVLLQWDYHQDGDINRYISYFSEDSISFTAADTVSGRFTTRSTVTGLNNGQEYWFYVTALDTADYESSASLQAKTEPYFNGPKWYVDTNNGANNGEGSSDEPLRDIQDGIDAANEGDTVFVLPGTYNRNGDQNLEFKNHSNDSPKHIVLMSRGGPDSTIIDCEGNETAFDISHGTDTTLQIIGFNIINGYLGTGSPGGSAIKIIGYHIGGQSPTTSEAVFKNCIIEDNDGKYSTVYIEGGVGVFRDCVIRNNSREFDLVDHGGAFRVASQDFGSSNYNLGVLVLDRSKVLSNSIYDITPQGYQWGIKGAGIRVNEAWAIINNSLIAGNYFAGTSTSVSHGAGISVSNGSCLLYTSPSPRDRG